MMWGAIGAAIRVYLQTRRDGHLPTGDHPGNLEIKVELLFGCIAGAIAWLVYISLKGKPDDPLIALLYLSATALGLALPDSIENLLKGFEPKPPGG